jgi:ABC-2 type transport system ATP-binding protein
LIYQGQILLQDDPQSIRARLPGEVIEVVTDDRNAAEDALRNLPGVLEIQNYGETLHVIVDSEKKPLKQIKRKLHKSGIRVSHITKTTPKMEEAFIYLIQQEIRQSADKSQQTDDGKE